MLVPVVMFLAAGKPGFEPGLFDGPQVLEARVGMKPAMKRGKPRAYLEIVTLIAGIEALIFTASPDRTSRPRPPLLGYSATAGTMEAAHKAQHLAEAVILSKFLGEYALRSAAKVISIQHLDQIQGGLGNDSGITKTIAAIETAVPEQLLGVSHTGSPSLLPTVS
jgi:hypothetical protein